MMNLYKILFLAFFSFFYSLESAAIYLGVPKLPTSKESSSVFANDFKEFRSLTVNDGFSRNSIFEIFQDKAGFIWFGSWDGVYRYDGSQLKHIYRTHKKDSKSRQIITEILEDDQNHIWIGTSQGIAVWDAENEKLIPFSDIVNTGATTSRAIKSLCKDQKGHIWILSHSDLYVFDQHDHSLTNVTYLYKENISKANRVYVDLNNNIWLTTDCCGIFKIKESSAQAGKPAQQKWKLVEEPLFKKYKRTNVQEMFQDSNHNYWLGISRGIVHVCQRKAGSLNLDGQNSEFFASTGAGAVRVSSFAEGGGCLYSATNKGLFVYSLKEHEYTWVLPNYSEPGCLNDKNLREVMVDREGGLWVGSFYGGVNYLAPTSGNFSTYIDINKHLEGHVVSGIAEDCRGNVWFGVEDGGVALWDRGDRLGYTFTKTSKSIYNPARMNVQGIYADNKNVYVGTFGGGMDIIDVATMKSRNLNSGNTYPDPIPNSIYAFYRASSRYVFLGSLNGLYYLDLDMYETHKVDAVEGKVNCIVKDEDDEYWVSTIYNGVYRFDSETKRWIHYVHDASDSTSIVCNDINTILAVNSSVYLGTQGNGLWEYRKTDGKFYPVAEEILGDALIFKILPYGDSFWITTNSGLYAYNRMTKQCQRFTSQDGLRSNLFKENAGIVTSDGIYIVGGVNGINCFRPSRLSLTLRKPEVILTEVSIFNKPVDMTAEDAPLEKSISYTDHMEINQKHNHITFRFSSSSHNDPNKNSYQYKLESFDKGWLKTTQVNNYATYTNLPAGTYVFKVRTSNGIGEWSEEKCVTLTVHPYWWWSLPMKLLYAVIVIGLIVAYCRHFQNKKKEEMRLFRFEKEQEMYHSKMEFFTCMVHEIRTPLTLILGPLGNIMKKSGRIEDVKPELRIIERNGNRLLSLVNQLMDFRKVEEKSYTVQMGPVNIKSLVEQITNEFKLYNVHKAVTIELKLPAVDCWANIDSEAFTKVLANLLSNAMKFTKDSIVVGIEEVQGEKEWNVYVRDNGCGIAKKDQSSIFDSFYQVHQDMPSDYIGTGIGLFVVRRLLELQGGSISLESQLNVGTCFIATVQRIEAPAEPVDAVYATPLMTTEEDEMDNSRNSDQKHLLVVEDNEEMRNFISSLFADKFQVDTCENGKVALEFTQKNEYDLVITDLMMPVMDGMTLCKILKRQSMTSHIPVIILTAKDDESSQKEGFDSEADLYVTKPFSAEVLLSQVKSVIHNRERLRKQFYSEPETTTEVLYTNNADKEFLEKFDELIAQRLENCNVSVDELAAEMALGRSVFYQKVKGVTGLTPNDYIRTFRLKKAATLFQNGETRINEVCYRVGFSSPSYFTKRFTMQFGISPSDYLKKLGQ